jgi:hypothetical protein
VAAAPQGSLAHSGTILDHLALFRRDTMQPLAGLTDFDIPVRVSQYFCFTELGVPNSSVLQKR